MLWTAQEFHVALGCLCTGIFIGALYDFFSLLRLPFRHWLADAFFDTLFYLLATALCALSLLWLNDGRVRFYTLFFIFLGCFLFMRLPSRLFKGLLRRIGKKWKKK